MGLSSTHGISLTAKLATCYALGMRANHQRRPKLRMPEPIDVTIDHARGPSAPWAKAAIRERTWREAVGGRIADRARPVELIRGTLRVRVATSVWASELSLLSEQIVARLRERDIPVTDLRFHVGPIERYGGPSEPKHRRAVPSSVALPRDLEAALLALEDDELREGIAGAARANLAWQDNRAKVPNEAPRGAQAPRDAGRGTDQPDRASAAAPEASRHTHGASPRRPT
jgi:hypothetical protein